MSVREARDLGEAFRIRVALAPSQVRQAPALNVIHFIVVTDAMNRICILMHGGAPSDA